MNAAPHITFLACLPRSRSAWCANLLTAGESFAYHEPLRWKALEVEWNVQRSTLNHAQRFNQPDWQWLAQYSAARNVVFCDTCFGAYWPAALEAHPDARILLLWRPRLDAQIAWNAAVRRWEQPRLEDRDGLHLARLEAGLQALAHYCDRHERPALHLFAHELDTLEGVRRLWGWCAPGLPFDERRARMLMDLQVEAILPRYIDASGPGAPRVRMIGDVPSSEFRVPSADPKPETRNPKPERTPCL